MKKAFEIKEVKPKVFLFEFNNNYDMCMYFLRYQEYYESSSPKFRGKAFDIFDFMKWYSLKFGKGVFTYPDDWNGFNIPGDIIKKVFDLSIPNKTIYDYEMFKAWNLCDAESKGEKFYIIGTVKRSGALNHEIAHAMFYLHPEYKKEMTKLVNALSPEIRKEMNSILKRLGYTPKVYTDEIQAYLATGLTDSFGHGFKTKWTTERKTFAKYYRKFSKTLK
jgi:hypothetical protein